MTLFGTYFVLFLIAVALLLILAAVEQRVWDDNGQPRREHKAAKLMKKLLILVFACSTLVGCGYAHRVAAHYTGYSTICVHGVRYIQFTSGATPEYSRAGTIQTCN